MKIHSYLKLLLIIAVPLCSSNANALNTLEVESSPSTVCSLPVSNNSGPLRLFFNADYQDSTCPERITGITPLPEPLDGLSAKLEMLLGQRIDPKILAIQDPYMPLDFSKAPKLDSILISTLVFRADFSGTLLSRALAWHAMQGTHVQLLVSEVIALPKDKALFEKLKKENPTFEIKLYRYRSPREFAIAGPLKGLHRVMHAKIFLTHSTVDKTANAVILGGRNVHDAFYFVATKARKPEWTEVVDYTKGDEAFVHWHDFEVKIASEAFVNSIAAQYQAIWNRDPKTGEMTHPFSSISNNETVASTYFDTNADEAVVRHFVSVPFSDDHALETLYVDLIDSAQKSILLATPYFNLTHRIGDAIERALARKVQIKLVTRIELKGDTADILLSDVNKRSINRFEKQLEVYEYLVPNTILHSKFVLIDGNVSLIGGINLNRRSFVHDIENGLLISSKDFYLKMEKLFYSYLEQSRLVTQRQKIKLWKRVVIGLAPNVF